MTWTALTFAYGSVLTSAKMSQLFDNFAAMAAGDAGAPTIVNATNQSGGTVNATTSTFSGLMTLTGGQIKFPAAQNASADANTLDDYEEGTWTPAVTGITANTVYGTYTKIGRMCHLTFKYTSASGSGGYRMTGQPFASLNVSASTPYIATCSVLWSSTSANYYNVIGTMGANSSYIDMFDVPGSTGATNGPSLDGLVGGTCSIYGNISYPVQ